MLRLQKSKGVNLLHSNKKCIFAKIFGIFENKNLEFHAVRKF